MSFLAKLLQRRGESTIAELREIAGVSNATIYRWIKRIERHFPQAVKITYSNPNAKTCARIKVSSIYG